MGKERKGDRQNKQKIGGRRERETERDTERETHTERGTDGGREGKERMGRRGESVSK